ARPLSRDPEAIRHARNLGLTPSAINLLKQVMRSATAQRPTRVRHVDHRAPLDRVETDGRGHHIAAGIGISLVEASPAKHQIIRHVVKAGTDLSHRYRKKGNTERESRS